jgi:hypothetical protein
VTIVVGAAEAGVSRGAVEREETRGGCGASGSGTRGTGVVLVSAGREGGASGGREVSFNPEARGATFGGTVPDLRLKSGSAPVSGRAGGRDSCGTGAKSAGFSTFPLLTKTRAAGLATMTRGAAPGSWPEATRPVAGFEGMEGVVSLEGGNAPEEVSRAGTMPVSGGALEVAPGLAKVSLSGAVLERLLAPLTGGAAGRGLTGVGRTSGSVLARDVEPLSVADCFNCGWMGETSPVGGRIVFCIGCVTAVDQAGGIF